ncbi:MAG: metallophosphoesterase [Tateyamaria sp.]|uniref:metallophosphoesterase n=1 Tax=Tateyamaria sp. TaxID=1929288 RepID=UPI00329AC991
MSNYHIIPDIHGQADKLDSILDRLGWRRTISGWAGPTPESRLVFLGDFIDGGAHNARVIQTVRSLIDSGKADAVMGNHEFNAICYHTISNKTGEPLREHSEKNRKQHQSFLAEFSLSAPETTEAVDWMKTLPLFREYETFRVVHACWFHPDVALVQEQLPGTRVNDEALQNANLKHSKLWDAVQTLTSGIEKVLPEGYSFADKYEHERHQVRIGWWLHNAKTWRDTAQSVPNPEDLPMDTLPPSVADYLYKDEKPVFFGHYWMTGKPRIEAPHALCLDYSAGKNGPLVAYDLAGTDKELSANRIVIP